jgi:hypothetical protein
MTLSEKPPETYLICPICCWEDAAADNELGSNRISLRLAQQNFIAFGACEQEWLDYVRAPTPTDQRDPDWLTLDEKADAAGTLLIKQITKAFEGVTRDGGVSLHEARAIDDYEGEQGRAEARKKDTDCRWQDVPDEWIEYFYDVFSFFDAKGFRYYIPAYMIWVLKNYRSSPSSSVDFTIYALGIYEDVDDPYARFRLLNAKQSEAVCNFLKLMATHGVDWVDTRVAKKALNQYWVPVNREECR